jgi:hypothetical protein
MPLGQAPRSSRDGVTSSERFEAATPHTRSILEEDVMLGFGAEMGHGCLVGERRAEEAMLWARFVQRCRPSLAALKRATVERETTADSQPSCMMYDY